MKKIISRPNVVALIQNYLRELRERDSFLKKKKGISDNDLLYLLTDFTSWLKHRGIEFFEAEKIREK